MTLLSAAYVPASSTPGRLEADDRLVFQHFPKTAGTTVHHCLASLFDPAEVCPERFDRYAFWPRKTLERYRFFSSHMANRQLNYIPGPVKVLSFFRNPVERCISLYDYWRSIALSEIEQNNTLQPRFARSYSPYDFFNLTDFEQRRPFWNFYTCGLAGDPLLSPSGRLWQSSSELLEHALASLERLAFVGISEDMTGSMDALCRQLDIPNMYNGQFHNITQLENEGTPSAQEQSNANYIDDDTLGLIKESNQLDQVVYERALALAFGSRERIRTIRCVPGHIPACRVRNGFADAWVENKAGGFILFGPYMRLLPGRYAVTFHLRCRSNATHDWSGPSLGHLDVVARKGELVLARHQLPTVLSSDETNEELTFKVTHVMSDAEFRVAAAPGAPFDVETTVVLRQI